MRPYMTLEQHKTRRVTPPEVVAWRVRYKIGNKTFQTADLEEAHAHEYCGQLIDAGMSASVYEVQGWFTDEAPPTCENVTWRLHYTTVDSLDVSIDFDDRGLAERIKREMLKGGIHAWLLMARKEV